MRGNYFPHLLLGRKLQYNRNQRIRESIEDQESFDELFKLVFHTERRVVQRAMRAVMLVAKTHPEFLNAHAEQILTLLKSPDFKDVKSMIILLIPKIELSPTDLERVWHLLTYLVLNQSEQKIIRTNALQSLYEFTSREETLVYGLHDTLNALTYDHAPAIQAKVLKLRGLLNKAAKVTA